MKKNMLNKLLFTFVCMFGLISTVFGVIGTGISGPKDPASNVLDSKLYIPDSSIRAAGIRISLLSSDGSQLYSKDFFHPRTNNKILNVAYSGSPCSKVSSCGVPDEWVPVSSKTTTTDLDILFSKYGFNANITSLVNNNNLDKDALFSAILNAKDDIKAKELFKELGAPDDLNYNEEVESYDLFLVWEPLSWVKYNDIYFIGTTYEISTMVEKENGVFVFENGTAYNGYDAVGKGVVATNGCAVYLENTDDFGNLVAEKFSSFSSKSYFGGSITEFISSCSNKTALKSYALSPSSSLGIGILWLDDIFGPKDNTLTCDTIDEFYGKGNVCSSIVNGTFDEFNAFNNHVKELISSGKKIKFPTNASSGITQKWYEDNCGCEKEPSVNPGGVDCTPANNVPNCDAEAPLKYKDSEDWDNCIFSDENANYSIETHKWSSNSSKYSYRESSLGSKYCPVYCREEVNAQFDSSNPTALAGSYFEWGWSTVKTTRTCKTKAIYWDKTEESDISFLDDLKEANQQVLNEYAKDLLVDLNKGGYWKEGRDIVGKAEPIEFDCTNIEYKSGEVDYGCNESDYIKKGYSCSYTNTGITETDTSFEHNHHFICTKDSDYNCTQYTYVNGVNSVTVNGPNGMIGTANVELSVCVDKNTPPTGNPASGGNLSAAITHVKKVVEDMKKCYNFDDSSVLTESSSAKIIYVNDVYPYEKEMVKSYSSMSYYVNSDTNSISLGLELDALSSCSGKSCSGTTFVDQYKTYSKTGSVTANFAIEDGVYQYVLKDYNNFILKSINADELENYSNGDGFTLNWIDIGKSNFPVPYNSSEGTYQDKLKIDYTNLGHTSAGTTVVDAILYDIDKENYRKWSCDYSVTTKLIPGVESNTNTGYSDINLIYRVIDLENPFPDIDAGTRDTGYNWCYLGENCSWNNDLVKKYILNNRNVESYEVYNLEPMYTFYMTPSDIIKIRKYNDDNKYSSYNGEYGEKKYDFKCIAGKGNGCRSDYLDELMEMMDAKLSETPGTCKDEKYRSVPTSIEEFNACRYLRSE